MKVTYDMALALISWSILTTVRVPLVLMGIFVVPLALPFKIKHRDTTRDYEEHNVHRQWTWVTLPDWAWIWSNDRDGARGDKRGWWDLNCGYKNSESFFAMWRWLSFRNPVNNMRFTPGLAVDMLKATVSVLAGSAREIGDKDDLSGVGWQFLKASDGKFSYYLFNYASSPWGKNKERMFRVKIGHKIAMKHNGYEWPDEQKAWKGFTMTVNPFLKYKD